MFFFPQKTTGLVPQDPSKSNANRSKSIRILELEPAGRMLRWEMEEEVAQFNSIPGRLS
jgi:hypothetical protein